MSDVDETIKRMNEGVALKVKMKRGTGTRDQDTITGKIKGEDVEDVENQREELVEQMKKAMEDSREVQPDEE